MPYNTTLENWLAGVTKIVEIGKGSLTRPLEVRQFTNCRECWETVVKQDPKTVITYVMLVVTKTPPMTNHAHSTLRELLKAICKRAASLKQRGDVLKGHEELMQALAVHMPELNADLREYEESLRRDALDPIEAVA